MKTVTISKTNYFDIHIFDILIDSITLFINKFKLVNIERKLDNIIYKLEPIQEKNFMINNLDEVDKYDIFLQYLEKLEDYLEKLEALELEIDIGDKLDKTLDIVTLLEFRISGAISDYRIDILCK